VSPLLDRFVRRLGTLHQRLPRRQDTRNQRLRPKALVALLVLAVAVGLLDPLVRVAANHMASDVTGGCARLEGTNVDLGTWPTAIRALGGSVHAVSVAIDQVAIGPLELHDVHARVGSVSFSPLKLLFGGSSVDVRDGQATVMLTTADIGRFLSDRGIPGQIVIAAGTTNLYVEILGLGVPLSVQVAGGGISFSLANSLLALVLPFRLVIRVPGIEVESVRVSPNGMTVTAAFAGQTAQLACAARASVT
jgi:hypothetical protein